MSYSMNTGISRICRGKHQAAMKFVANASPPQEQREEQSSADLPMEKADSTIVDHKRTCDSCYHRKNHQVRYYTCVLSYLLVCYGNTKVFYT